MASESKPMDIEEEVPEIEDEVKKPEDEGQVAEREWEYQREPEAQDIEAPDIFASYRKETLPIFETRRKISNPFKKKKPKKIGKLTWEDDVKTIADHIKEQKEESSKPEYSGGEKHLMDHPNTKEYSFYKSMLEFHDKIVGDTASEEEPIGAQPTGAGRRRTPAAPFKRGRGKKVGQQQSLVGGKKLPFSKKQPKGTVGRGGKGKRQRAQMPSVSPSANPSGAMAGLASEYGKKTRGGKTILTSSGKPKIGKKPPEKPSKAPQRGNEWGRSDRAGAQREALKLPMGKDDEAAGGGAMKPKKEEDRKVPRPKKERNTWFRRRRDSKEAKRIQGRTGAKETGTDKLTDKERKWQKRREARGKKIKRPSSGSGAPKIAAMKAWYSEIYGI